MRAVQWPSLIDEIGEFRTYLRGRVLNAGSGVPIGDRDISQFVDGEIINQDIFRHELIQATSPLHEIPFESDYFDAVFCNAVLEHVKNPADVIGEIFRVLRPEGHLYLVVPFMQPEHLVPTDYQRYTLDGLKTLVENAGFRVVKEGGVHNVYVTIGWIVEEWLNNKNSLRNRILGWLLLPTLRYLSRNSDEYVHTIASAYRVIATKVTQG